MSSWRSGSTSPSQRSTHPEDAKRALAGICARHGVPKVIGLPDIDAGRRAG
jgi:hypothetical protein